MENSDEMRINSEVIGMGGESFEILLYVSQAYVTCLSSIMSLNNFDSPNFIL
jgi:hypothetical protein